ncbi:hypothetical protein L873DRAFT_1663413 [Choiromyces venosus 120613-1]|uniref:Uncharacterized protein n=1 Tax=Choiromyces venosus 120613-1 TaxID=1336337 RepID=A0A3N4K3V0_9PEZI|nr:hypothetical protein L873DRAFT_1663413 [Choiromyces venosus 120613-1]
MTTYGGGGYSSYGTYDDRSSRTEMLPFFVPGDGIKRQVIQTDLPRYLGNNAYSRPGKNQGVDGFWYTAYRPLTDAQIQSLKVDSQRWSNERELMSHRHPGRDLPGYERSATFRDSLRTNPEGNNPEQQYSYPPPQGSTSASTSFHYGGTAPGYHPSSSTYNPQQAPSVPAIQPAPPGGRGRYEYMPPPDNRPWYDNETNQYVPPFNPPENVSATIPRSSAAQNDPQPGTSEEADMPYRRPMEPNTGPEPTGYYGSQSSYYSRGG